MNTYLTDLGERSEGVARQLRSHYINMEQMPAINPYGRDFFTIPQTIKAEHMYPDIILVKATDKCLGECAFCFRRREMNDELETITEKEIDAIFGKYVPEYNSSQKGYMTKIREVLITGGDPLLLGMDLLENMLKRAKDAGIEHIRIGSRASSVSPQLVTDGLVDMLAQYKPLTIIAHYNHPDELTKESLNASDRFLDAGIRVKEHGVLLRGVNDDVETLYRLFSELVSHGIQPYRLMHCMPIGYEQLRTTVREGMSIARELRSMRGSVGHFDYSIVTPLGKIVGVTEEHILDEKTGQALIDEHRDSPQGILPNRIAPEATYLKLAITSRTIKDGSIPKQVWYRDGRSKY